MDDWTQQCGPQLASTKWIAGRVHTLLSHYYQPDQGETTTEAVISDWISTLRQLPKEAISASCDSYIRDQPRRRPTPGEIYNRAKTHFENARRLQITGPGGLDEDEAKVVDWAVERGYLSRSQAIEAVQTARKPDGFPPWISEHSKIERGIHCVRHHPNTRYKPKGAA